MMGRLWALATGTWREAVRAKAFVNLGVVAVFGLLLAQVLDGLALGTGGGRVLADVALAVGSAVNALLCATAAVQAVGRDAGRTSLLMVLVRPLPRTEVVVGRWLGVVAIGVANGAALSALLAILLVRAGWSTVPAAQVALTLAMEAVVVTALAFAFAVSSGSTVAVAMTLALWAAGQLSGGMLDQVNRMEGAGRAVFLGIYALLPHLAQMDLLAAQAWPTPMHGLYVVAYAAAALAVAGWVFDRQDIQ